MHDGVVEQRQSAADAIIALRRDIRYIHFEVTALPDVFQQFAAAYYQAVASRHDILLAIEGETTFSFMTIGVAQISLLRAVTHIH